MIGFAADAERIESSLGPVIPADSHVSTCSETIHTTERSLTEPDDVSVLLVQPVDVQVLIPR